MVRADRNHRRLGLLAAATLAAVLGPAVAASAGAPATRRAAGEASTRPVRPPSGVESRRVADKTAGEGVWPWLRTLGALAVVVGLIFAARFVLRRVAGASHLPARAKALEVIARAPLGARQQFVIVRLGRRLVLVGSGPAGMSALAEVSEPAEVADLLAELGTARADAFADALKRHEKPGTPGQSVRGLAGKIRSQLLDGKEDQQQ